MPAVTAGAVRLLEDDGYFVVGKTNLHEFAYGVTSRNPHYGVVPNPRHPGRTAGGSSGGSAAAVAAGLADVAVGSDSGGSIRIPAACCGVVGFKPSYGLVTLDGCFPLAPTFDHAGPIASSVEACAAALEALVPGFAPAPEVDPADLLVGVAWTDRADPLVRARVEETAARFPNRRSLDLPLPERTGAVFMREVADVHRELYEEHGELYGDDVRTKIERCLAVPDAAYAEGGRRRDAYREAAAAALDGLDVLLTPTVGFVAPPAHVEDLEILERMVALTYPFNLLGWPALALPCGAAERGLPASVQLVAPAGGDAVVLAAAAALERGLSPV